MNWSIASGVLGMLAPSATRTAPFLRSVFASSPLISFCVALGNAQSHLMPHGRLPSRYLAPYLSAYSLIRPVLIFFIFITRASFSSSMPSGSKLKNINRGRIKKYADKYGAKYLEGKRPWGIKCDCAFPSATQNEISGDDAKKLLKNGCPLVAGGAKLPRTPGAN